MYIYILLCIIIIIIIIIVIFYYEFTCNLRFKKESPDKPN